MTQETDGIITYFRSTGVPGVVTDINTPGVHARHSFHYAVGTPSSHVEPLDHFQGHEGQAVDLSIPGQSDTEGIAAIFRSFGPVESKLTELIHSGPNISYFIHNGQRVPIGQLNPAIRSIHHNHTHVAVAKGTILAPIPAGPSEEDMPPTFVMPCSSGGYWEVRRKDGAVYAWSGAPFFGGLSGTAINAPIAALGPHQTNGVVDGYWLLGEDGGVYAFGAAPFTDSYAGHPSWHPGQRYFTAIIQSGNGYNIIATESGTDPPRQDVYDLSIKR